MQQSAVISNWKSGSL